MHANLSLTHTVLSTVAFVSFSLWSLPPNVAFPQFLILIMAPVGYINCQSCILGSKAKNTSPDTTGGPTICSQCHPYNTTQQAKKRETPASALFPHHLLLQRLLLLALSLLPLGLSSPLQHMKGRRGSSGGGDHFAVFPFSIGCMSQSAVSVADPSEKKPQSDPSPSSTTTTATAQTAAGSEEGAAGGETVAKEKAAAETPASPGLVAAGVSRLMKGIKSLSLMFAGDNDDEEEEERELVIGYPTDVQHVGHIGWDGHNKVGAMGMVNAFSMPSSLSLRQLEMAMDQATHASA